LPAIDTVAVAVRGYNGVAIIEGLALRQIVDARGIGVYGIAADPVHNQIVVVSRDSGTARILYKEGQDWKNDGAEIRFQGDRPVPFEAAYNPANQKLYVVYNVHGPKWYVDVFDKQSAHQVTRRATIPVGDGGGNNDPNVGGTGLIVNPNTGNVFNANTIENTVSVISPDDKLLATVSTGPDPFMLTVDPGANTIYVALRAANRIQKIKDAFTRASSKGLEQNTVNR
ncbi:MAG: hypothetical protein D6790_07650, partial [Caldilineae bacterium]